MKRKFALVAVLVLLTFLPASQTFALHFAAQADNIAYLPVHQMGYDGSGVIAAVINASFPRPTHRTFYVSGDNTASRVTRMDLYGGDNGVGPIGHANSVAGIMAGRGKGDGSYLGVAPGAEIWSASCGAENDIVQAYLDFSSPNAQGRSCQIFVMPLVFTAGGQPAPDNGEASIVKFMDWLATERNVLISFGAGNDSDRIRIPGGAYNHLTVGALSQDLLGVGNISGRGPTADGRSKPDVVAPGTNVHLPGYSGDDTWGQDTSGNSYTSISAPFGAGVSALIRQYGDSQGWTWDPRVTKCVILNSATKLSGWTHTDTQPLDNEQGAGRIDALQAIHQYVAGQQGPGSVNPCGWDLDNVNNLVNNVYTMNEAAQDGYCITASLTWYRYTDYVDNEWVTTRFENLDLYLYRDSDNTLVAQSISPIDSVEHIYYHVPQTGTYRLEVDLVGVGDFDESYAVSWYTSVPEPATTALLALGVAGLSLLRRRRR